MTKIMNFMKSKNKTPFWIHFWPLGNKSFSVKSKKRKWTDSKKSLLQIYTQTHGQTHVWTSMNSWDFLCFAYFQRENASSHNKEKQGWSAVKSVYREATLTVQ